MQLRWLANVLRRFFRLRLLPIYIIIYVIICYYYYRHLFETKSILRVPPSTEKYTIYNNFCVIPNVISSETQETDRITQILHMSSNILDERLLEQIENWNGPVSLAVVIIHKMDYSCAMNKLTEYRSKSDLLKKYLRVHLIFPTSWSSTCTPPESRSKCRIPQPTTEELADYPANTARNVARMYSVTNYILIADYEHLFSKNFEKEVLKVAQKTPNNEKRVLVYRVFEIDKDVKKPSTKNELKKLMDKKKAVVFHSTFYHAHAIPNLAEWFRENRTEFGVSDRNISYKHYYWEPQFVSRSDIPLHDLNFPFLVRDNTCLRWELCRAGYQFDVLSDHFMYHKGIKKANETGNTKKIQKRNSKRFTSALASFNKRMDQEYPNTKRICPKFHA